VLMRPQIAISHDVTKYRIREIFRMRDGALMKA